MALKSLTSTPFESLAIHTPTWVASDSSCVHGRNLPLAISCRSGKKCLQPLSIRSQSQSLNQKFWVLKTRKHNLFIGAGNPSHADPCSSTPTLRKFPLQPRHLFQSGTSNCAFFVPFVRFSSSAEMRATAAQALILRPQITTTSTTNLQKVSNTMSARFFLALCQVAFIFLPVSIWLIFPVHILGQENQPNHWMATKCNSFSSYVKYINGKITKW